MGVKTYSSQTMEYHAAIKNALIKKIILWKKWKDADKDFIFIFWPNHGACGILDPRPRIKPRYPALEVQSLDQCLSHQGSQC